MRLKVNPNRMELLKLKKRRTLAQRGHDLLEDKLDELLRRFMELIKKTIELERTVSSLIAKDLMRFLYAYSVVNKQDLDKVLTESKSNLMLEVETERVMNVKIPRFRINQHQIDRNYKNINISLELDLALESQQSKLELLLELAEAAKAVELLGIEIKSTRRRVNALEYILLPTINDTIGYINDKLNELERDSLTRLMRVKEIINTDST